MIIRIPVTRSGGDLFNVIGNFVSYYIKTLREDATGAHLKVQADACAHQRAKSRNAALCSLWREFPRLSVIRTASRNFR